MSGSYGGGCETIKAVSVRQPFASAIVLGHKPVENRTWATKHRGPLLIHAAGKPYRFPRDFETREERELRRLGLMRPRGWLAMGAIVGIVELIDCLEVGSSPASVWTSGPWCWKLGNPVALPEPVPFRGALSLFDVVLRGLSSSASDTIRAAIRQMGCDTMS